MTITEITVVGAVVAGVTGWVANLVQIVSMVSDPISTLFILKCAGLFMAPVGSILGLIGMF